ncbi:MAG TPA: ATP-binding protein [Acidimicrobiales bacterium]|nr:ATP-binding protein [Acidimicrobiales bacterium]
MKRRLTTPLVVGLLVLAAATPSFVAARNARNDRDRRVAHARAAAAAAADQANRRATARLLLAGAAAIDGNQIASDTDLTATLLRFAPAGQVMGVVRTTAATSLPVVAAVPPASAPKVVGLDFAQQPAVQLAFALARDAGVAKSARGRLADGSTTVVQAQALYGGADPLDVAGRRQALAGYLVSLSPPVAAPKPAAHTSALPVLPLVAGLGFAIAIAVIVGRRERAVHRSEAEAAARAEELALIARMGPMLQQSLTLSELLPLFVVEVGNEFDFDACSVSLATETGELSRVFSIGADLGADSTAETVTDRGPIAANTYVHIALERSGRTIGVVRARPVNGMSERQVESLVAACTLLSAALGNAQLFENEQRMVARLRDVDAMKIAFVGSVSHELRTSATAIEGFAGLLDNDRLAPDDPRRADYIQRIRRNARSLGLLIEDLLDFARMERGSGPVLKRVDLTKVVPEVVDQLSPVLGDRPISVVVTPDVAVNGDLSMVERILANLLTNAAKYTPPNSPIEVGLGIEDGAAVLAVVDHGGGIAPEERENVFRLFYRVDDESLRATRGIGIGLALVKQLVEQMHGEVRINETPQGGATFRVTLPLFHEAKEAAQEGDETWPHAVTA